MAQGVGTPALPPLNPGQLHHLRSRYRIRDEPTPQANGSLSGDFGLSCWKRHSPLLHHAPTNCGGQQQLLALILITVHTEDKAKREESRVQKGVRMKEP